jgi:thiamine kinase-like enzyme
LTNPVISDTAQLNAEWLNGVLAKSAAIVTGGVERFQYQYIGNLNSQSVTIQLAYKTGSTGKLPRRLFLKMCSGEGVFGPSEVHYYTRDYVGLADAPLPTCYDAAYWPEPRMYYILMDDLSETHFHNKFTTPTLDYGCKVVEGLAVLHAHWWGAKRLQAVDATCGKAEINRYMDFIRAGLSPMLEAVKDDISNEWKTAIEAIFERHPNAMIRRSENLIGLTIVHGDVNPTNVLSPHDPQGKTYIVDRQPFDWSLTTWTAASDLAYMMVTWWEPPLRHQLELPVLRHYHQALVQRGVSDYSWEQLVDDYKLSVMQSLYVAAQWCTNASVLTQVRSLWFAQLQRSMTAFDDLECAELLS